MTSYFEHFGQKQRMTQRLRASVFGDSATFGQFVASMPREISVQARVTVLFRAADEALACPSDELRHYAHEFRALAERIATQFPETK